MGSEMCIRDSLQGVLKRHLDGNASADNAASVGGQAKMVAGLGEDILSDYITKKADCDQRDRDFIQA